MEQRHIIGERYNQVLDKAGISRVQQRNDRSSIFAQYTVFTDDREELQKSLKDIGIPTAVHYALSVNEQQAYKSLCCPDCTPVSKSIAKKVLSLPMGPFLSEIDQADIIIIVVCRNTQFIHMDPL